MSEFNTLYYGKCLEIRVDEHYDQNDDQKIGVEVGLQMLDGANHTVKVFFNRDKSVYDMITGFHPRSSSIEVEPHKIGYFQLRCME